MKLIVSDLDGTLLDEMGEISEKNAQSINKAINEGIQFIVATGRSYEAALQPLQDAGITCPIISMNGATIYSKEGRLIHRIPMDVSITKKISKLCEQENVYIEFCTNGGIFSKSRNNFVDLMINVVKSSNPDMTEEEINTRAKHRLQEDQVKHIDNFEELYTRNNLEIYKILGFSLQKEKLALLHKTFLNKRGLSVSSSSAINIEFNHVDAQKGSAIDNWSKNLGINMQDVMVLGDSFNDVSMLEIAGRSVAMENAPDEIKSLCDYTTLSNNQNGVSVAIEKMLEER